MTIVKRKTPKKVRRPDPNVLTAKESKVLQGLTRRGFAVIVWTPEELGKAPALRVERRSIAAGWIIIDDLQEANDIDMLDEDETGYVEWPR